jgi:aquaporin Z
MRLAAPGHWREYACEAFGLALFMVSACAFGALLFHPASPVVAAIPSPLARRALMGLAMAATALVNVYSPWGRRSGSHLNPAVTLTFLRLGKVAPRDAAWYVMAQFAGGIAGALVAVLFLHRWVMHPEVHYVVTEPGRFGTGVAFMAEVAMATGLMVTVLAVSSHHRWQHHTGVAAAALIAMYITFESPLSGMSMNPARTLGSALPAHHWHAMWVYFLAPPLGMLLGAAIHLRANRKAEFCAKIDHDPRVPCIFCEFHRHRPA